MLRIAAFFVSFVTLLPLDARAAVPESVKRQLRQAELHLDNGKPQEAINELDQVLEGHPKLTEAYYLRGYAQQTLGLSNRAIADYSKLLELDPDHVLARGRSRTDLAHLRRAA
jgi:tetratricopeptide (TPR) repeat protein